MPMTSEEILDTFDIIVLGTIIDVKESKDKPITFQIEIEEIINADENKKTITAIGWEFEGRIGISCPSFDIGDRGLFLISKSEQGYEVSSRSQVAQGNCTAQQFLANYKGMESDFFWTQEGQLERFFTGKPVDIHYILRNPDMTQRDYAVRFSSSGVQSVFSDVVNGTIPECIGRLTVTTSFVPTKMGMYGFNARSDGGGSGAFGTAIIDYGTSPLEQHMSGIHSQDTWCKEGLFLILKNDDTPNQRYDNYPACVALETAEKLVWRDWGFVPHESNAFKYFQRK